MRYRYPGPKPFTEKDENLFFGRTEEKEQLNSVVRTNKLTVLFGRSGFGKSSLIQAALIPFFKRNLNYKIVEIRFTGSSSKTNEPVPIRLQLIEELKKLISKEIFLNDIQPGQTSHSLWQLFKTLQWEAKNDGYNGVLFILDQFEEIFNFPRNQHDSLAGELAELIYNRTPRLFQENLMKKLEDDEFYEQHKEQVGFIQTELPTNFLIGIRSDRLYLLDDLGDFIPMIFNNRFKLRQLEVSQINDIIEAPAKQPGDFASPPFSFSKPVINRIKQFFTTKGDDSTGKHIEAFELQIICQLIEEKVIEQAAEDKTAGIERKIIVDESFLPENIDDVIKSYYIDIVKGRKEETKSFTEFEKLIIRFLVERKLIDNKTNSRICLDKTSILPLGFDDILLNKLAETRLIRKELNTVSGQSFELSHDTLVQPIQIAAKSNELKDLQALLGSYYSDVLKRAGRDGLFSKWRSLEKIFVDKLGNIPYFTESDFIPSEKNTALLNELIDARIIKVAQESPRKYILNEAFQDVVIERNSRYDFSTLRKFVTALVISGFVLAGVLFVLVKALRLSQRESFHRVVNNVNINSGDPDSVAMEKLLVYNTVFSQFKDYSQRRGGVSEKLIRQFKMLYLFAKTVNPPNRYVVNYSVSPSNKILGLFSDKPPAPEVPMFGTADVVNYNPYLAVLYDSSGKMTDSFPGVLDAAFVENSNNLVVVKRGSVITYNREQVPTLNGIPGYWELAKLSPKFVLRNEMLYGKAVFLRNIPTMLIAIPTNPIHVIINLRTGKTSVQKDDNGSTFYARKDDGGFVKMDPVKGIEVLNIEGKKENSITLAPGLQVVPGNTDNKYRINGIIARNSSNDYSYMQADTSKAGVDNFYYYDLQGTPVAKISLPKVVNCYYTDNNHFITVSLDMIRVFKDGLVPVDSFALPGTASYIFSVTGNKMLTKFLVSTGDSTLLVISKNKVDTVYTGIPNPRIKLSDNGKFIFCFENNQNINNGNAVVVLDSTLRIIGNLNNYAETGNNNNRNMLVFNKRGQLVIVNPENTFLKLNVNNPDSVSAWLYKNKYEASPTLLKRYKAAEDILTQLKNLFKDDY